jgi:hypothetical protein
VAGIYLAPTIKIKGSAWPAMLFTQWHFNNRRKRKFEQMKHEQIYPVRVLKMDSIQN